MATNAAGLLTELRTEATGFIAGALADSDSGMALAAESASSSFDVEVAAAVNTEVVKAKLRAMKSLKVDGGIEDILITLKDQYHLIRPTTLRPTVFWYMALDRKTANLAMARFALRNADAQLTM